MDFQHSAAPLERLGRLERFIDDRVRPAEGQIERERAADSTRQPLTLEALELEAREAGLWNLCVRDPRYPDAVHLMAIARRELRPQSAARPV